MSECMERCIHEKEVESAKKNQSLEIDVEKTAQLFKILGDKTRLRIIDLLKYNELCVCDISYILNISQSLTSHQLRKLKENGIVRVRKEGLTSFYSINDEHILNIYLNALDHIKDCI